MELVSGGILSRRALRTSHIVLVAVYQCFHSCVSAFIVLEERTDREDSEKYAQKYLEEYPMKYPAAKTSTEA